MSIEIKNLNIKIQYSKEKLDEKDIHKRKLSDKEVIKIIDKVNQKKNER